LLAYWSLQVIGPFVTILLWSGILTVALYPVFSLLVRLIGSKSLAAVFSIGRYDPVSGGAEVKGRSFTDLGPTNDCSTATSKPATPLRNGGLTTI
jgi:hypothetical protein